MVKDRPIVLNFDVSKVVGSIKLTEETEDKIKEFIFDNDDGYTTLSVGYDKETKEVYCYSINLVSKEK